MKRINIVFLIAMIVFLTVRCSEGGENPVMEDMDRISIPGSVVPDDVIVELENSVTPRKYIYLTIDDSPLNGSGYIDSIIMKEKIKTNLFIVGKTIKESGRFLKYYNKLLENPYIEMYNHSYSHASNKYDNYYKKPESVLEDFERNRSEFHISHKIARLPGRNLWYVGEKKKNFCQTGSDSAELLVENGYCVFGWDIEWKYSVKDYTPKESIDELIREIEEAYAGSKTFVPNHVVLLMHDQMFEKTNEKNDLAELITKLKENNYAFEYLSLYPFNQDPHRIAR